MPPIPQRTDIESLVLSFEYSDDITPLPLGDFPTLPVPKQLLQDDPLGACHIDAGSRRRINDDVASLFPLPESEPCPPGNLNIDSNHGYAVHGLE